MADETINLPPEPAPEVVTPDPAAEVARLTAELARQEARASAYEAAIQAVQQRPQPMAPQAQLPGGVSPEIYQYLRQQGFNDEAIATNAQIIMPFLSVAAQQVGAVLQQQQSRIEFLQASRNKKAFKHWDALEEHIAAVQMEAERNGRFMPAKEAYAIAYANNPQIAQATQTTQAQAQAHVADLAAQNNLSSAKTRVNTDLPKTPTTASEISQMAPEERSKLWDALADTPIQ